MLYAKLFFTELLLFGDVALERFVIFGLTTVTFDCWLELLIFCGEELFTLVLFVIVEFLKLSLDRLELYFVLLIYGWFVALSFVV